MFYIQAMNIHQGGGRTLLLGIVQALASQAGRATLLLDRRFSHDGAWPAGIDVRRVEPSIRARLAAEYWLSRHIRAGDTLLCLGNLPPLFPTSGSVMVYFHNRLIIEPPTVEGFSRRARIRLWIERQWVRRLEPRVHRWLVQTPSMKILLHERGRAPLATIDIRNFAPDLADGLALEQNVKSEGLPQFIYPASGDPHKNHKKLVEAWALLKADGLRPILHLTVDPALHPGLVRWIDTQRAIGELAIFNHGHLPPGDLARLSAKADALIYPSLSESFGLPLLDARRQGLPVIAGELDYVRDSATPIETFDPLSARSISRAVRRFMGSPEEPRAIGSPADLLDYIRAYESSL